MYMQIKYKLCDETQMSALDILRTHWQPELKNKKKQLNHKDKHQAQPTKDIVGVEGWLRFVIVAYPCTLEVQIELPLNQTSLFR